MDQPLRGTWLKGSSVDKEMFSFKMRDFSTSDKLFSLPTFSLMANVQEISFHFGTGTTFKSSQSPTKSFTAAIIEKRSQIPAEEGGPDEIESKILVGVTGEESEEILVDVRAKLYQKEQREKDKIEWFEKGLGNLHFNMNREEGFYRIVLRRDPLGIVALNSRIGQWNRPKIIGDKNNRIQFVGTSSDGQHGIFILLLENSQKTQELLNAWNDAIEQIKSGKMGPKGKEVDKKE
jgi:hypothetical protein